MNYPCLKKPDFGKLLREGELVGFYRHPTDTYALGDLVIGDKVATYGWHKSKRPAFMLV